MFRHQPTLYLSPEPLTESRVAQGSELKISTPFRLWLTFLSSFQGLFPKEPSTTSLSAFVDANDSQGLGLAGGPGRRAALRTSAGGERQSRGLVHRLEGRQAFRHRHGR